MSDLRDDAVRWAERVLKRPEGYDSEYVNAARYIISPPAPGPAFDAIDIEKFVMAVHAAGWSDAKKRHSPELMKDKVEKFVAELRAALDTVVADEGWRPIDTVPVGDIPVLVWLPIPSIGSHVHSATFHPNVKIVGHQFKFDLESQPTHWRPLPPAPSPNERNGDK